MKFYTILFVMVWSICVTFKLVSSATHDVHRIVLTSSTHYRRNKDREHDHHNHKHYPTHVNHRRPATHDSHEDEWPSASSSSSSTTKNYYHYDNYRSNTKNENRNGYKRGKTRYSSTTKPLNVADIELTTVYPDKLPVPLIDSYFQNYYQHPFPILNNSIDLFIPNNVRNNENTINITFTSKNRQLREKEIITPRNSTKGYEVYEEIIGDISPPPLPDLRHNNNIQSFSVLNTPMPLVSTTTDFKDGGNHIKENVSDVSDEHETTTRGYGKRTKSRRNRGNSKF